MPLLVDIPIAFVSGLLTVLSPCGLPLLPGLLIYYFKDKEGISGFLGGFVALLGILTFAIPFGILAIIFKSALNPLISYFELIAGILVILFGVFILFNIKVPFFKLKMGVEAKGTYLSLYLFGIAYALAGIGCTVGVFFSVILLAVSKPIVEASIIYMVYAISIGLPIMLLTSFASEFRKYFIDKIIPHLNKIRIWSGIFLILVGIYLVVYFILFKLGIITVI